MPNGAKCSALLALSVLIDVVHGILRIGVYRNTHYSSRCSSRMIHWRIEQYSHGSIPCAVFMKEYTTEGTHRLNSEENKQELHICKP